MPGEIPFFFFLHLTGIHFSLKKKNTRDRIYKHKTQEEKKT